jgi:K319-like protein
MLRSLACALILLAPGCGARSSLRVDPAARRDGGTSFDGSTADGGGTLVVDCGRSTQYTSPRRSIRLEASVSSPDTIVDQRWALTASPPGSSPVFAAGTTVATLTPDVLGSYVVRFDARDAGGRSASCEVQVMAITGPPVALCPEEDLFTGVDVPLVLAGDGFDDEMIVRWRWEIVSQPPGSFPQLFDADGPTAEFSSSTRGSYMLRLTVFDADRASGSCEVEVIVSGPPDVRCDPTMISAPTRQTVALGASATDDVGIVSRRWEVLERPSGSTAIPMPADADRTSLVPDRRGTYRLRFTATDVEGSSASCEVTLIGLPTPPTLTCPAQIDTRPLAAVTVTASAVDDGTIVRWAWSLASQPLGSDAAPPSPSNAASTSFTPDIAGIYELIVTATDDDGMTASCTTRVAAGNVDGLRVEMFWDTATDMDTHLLNPTGTRWFTDNDCYYSNCNVSNGHNLEWGAAGDDDNPRLDIDDIDGFGPENINITTPVPGTYRVAIHNFSGDGPNQVTVQIYCGGSTTVPRATFGPVALRGRGSNTQNDFWRVADVAVSATGCTITDLTRADGAPWIEVQSSTIGMR